MNKKQFRHRGNLVKIKESFAHTDVEVVINKQKYAKRFVDKRPDQTIPMTSNDIFEWQIKKCIDEIIDNNG